VTAMDRTGLLKDLTSLFANEKVKVSGMKSRNDYKKQLTIMDFDLEVFNADILGRLITRVEQVKDVIEAIRLS
ncbi:hypothetical protein L4C31_03650, partial [Aliivibrio sifiae]